MTVLLTARTAAAANDSGPEALFLPVSSSGEETYGNHAIRICADHFGTVVDGLIASDETIAEIVCQYFISTSEDVEIEEYGMDEPEYQLVLSHMITTLTLTAEDWIEYGEIQQAKIVLWWIRSIMMWSSFSEQLFDRLIEGFEHDTAHDADEEDAFRN